MLKSRCATKLQSIAKRVCNGVCAIVLTCGLLPSAGSVAFADESALTGAEITHRQFVEELALAVQSGESCDFTSGTNTADTDSQSLSALSETTAESTLPRAFSLAHVGGSTAYNTATQSTDITGGTNYVTSVKSQKP